MLNVAVVDDEQVYLVQIENIVSRFLLNKNIETRIYTYNSGEELLKAQHQFDIVFLDIQMNGIDGIETAQVFRRDSKSTAFFYVTSYAEYALRAMTMHPFAYIVKPIKPSEIENNLMDYLEYRAAFALGIALMDSLPTIATNYFFESNYIMFEYIPHLTGPFWYSKSLFVFAQLLFL